MNRIMAIIAAVTGIWFLLIPRSMGQAIAGFAFATILLVFAYRRFSASRKRTAEYTSHNEDGWQRIEVLPAAAPLNWFAAIGSVVFGGATVGGDTPGLWVMGYLFAAIAGLGKVCTTTADAAAWGCYFR